MTVSEHLFEKFCRHAGIRFERVQADEGKTPDYDIFLGDLRVVVEIKEVDPVLPGPTGVTTFTVGKAVRHDLKKAGKQVKARAQHEVPGMVVLFEEKWQQLEPSSIRAAMYGAHTVDIGLPSNMGQPPTFLGHRLGAGRQVTREHNTSIGVVAHLQKEAAGRLSLTAYHNRYARLPIPPNRLATYEIRQFMLPEVQGYGIPDWREIGG